MKWSFIRVGTVGSTQVHAQTLARQGAEEGLVIIASSQTAGKGSKGRAWISPKGGTYMSLVLRPTRSDGIEALPLVGAFAVAGGIRKDTGIVPSVRWPNDVLIDGRKVAGIIAESAYRENAPSYVILGIGINSNVRKEALRQYAEFSTSLMNQLGVKVDQSILRSRVLESFAILYEQWEARVKVVRQRKGWISTIGREVEIIRGNTRLRCWAEDVREDGSLVVKVGKARRVIRVEDMDRLMEI